MSGAVRYHAELLDMYTAAQCYRYGVHDNDVYDATTAFGNMRLAQVEDRHETWSIMFAYMTTQVAGRGRFLT